MSTAILPPSAPPDPAPDLPAAPPAPSVAQRLYAAFTAYYGRRARPRVPPKEPTDAPPPTA